MNEPATITAATTKVPSTTAVTTTKVPSTTSTVSAATISVTASRCSFSMRDFNLDFLTINCLAIEIFTGVFGVTLISHGHESIAFSSVEDVTHMTRFGKFSLQQVTGTRRSHPIDKQFDTVAVVAHLEALIVRCCKIDTKLLSFKCEFKSFLKL